MHRHPKASLVVLNYNSLEKLGPQTTDYLQSISETDYPNLEIVIVDNASTDGSLERIEEMFRDDARVKII
ncbi:MAG: glycosyltransferase, partial [Candidatus Caldarchaeum sp.]